MAEYIEREALITAIHADTQHLQSFDESFADLLMIDIEEAPTADVAPVRHGLWIKRGYACGDNEYECSVCHETEWRTSAIRLKYCPYCGARMDGGVSDA